MKSFNKEHIISSLSLIRKKTSIYFILVVLFWIAAEYIKLPAPYMSWLHRFAWIATLFQVALWGHALIDMLIKKVRKNSGQVQFAALNLIRFFANLVLYSVLFLIALNIFGFNVTTIVAGLGVGGIAVALAVQNILSDLFSSMTIAFDKPFEVGDFIVVGSELGTVESIGIKTTRVRALSGEQLVFSNSDLLGSRIHNYKRMNRRRVVLEIKISYHTPIPKLIRGKEIITEEVQQLPQTTFDRCHFARIDEYSLNYEIVYFVNSPDYNRYMDIHEQLLINIRRRFLAEEIEFAIQPLEQIKEVFKRNEGELNL